MNDNKLSARVHPRQSIYFVYIPSSKMLLLKTTSNAEEQYYYADTYSRVYLDFNLPPSVLITTWANSWRRPLHTVQEFSRSCFLEGFSLPISIALLPKIQ